MISSLVYGNFFKNVNKLNHIIKILQTDTLINQIEFVINQFECEYIISLGTFNKFEKYVSQSNNDSNHSNFNPSTTHIHQRPFQHKSKQFIM